MKSYDPLYDTFDSPLMQQLRREAYGEDIGQHSWATADELRSDIKLLSLTASSRLLDIGCGPCGPLVFAVCSTGCTGAGLDVSKSALASGNARAHAAGAQERIRLFETDLNQTLRFDNRSFDAVISVDVILHIRERRKLFNEVARVLAPAGKFLFTDAGIIQGPISNEEIVRRSAHGYTQFVLRGVNEDLLNAAGFMLIAQEDRTTSVEIIAQRRLRAMRDHQNAVEELVGEEAFRQRQDYLEMMIELYARGALGRAMYFAELAVV